MKKMMLAAMVAFTMASCGGEKKEHKLEGVGLTISVSGEPKIECDPATEYNGARCNFYVNNKRSMITKIEASEFPTDAEMIEQAIKTEDDFVAVKEKKKLENGAFGLTWDKKNSKGETIQNFLFYFKKGEDHFKIQPLFNGDGSTFPDIIESIGTLK